MEWRWNSGLISDGTKCTKSSTSTRTKEYKKDTKKCTGVDGTG